MNIVDFISYSYFKFNCSQFVQPSIPKLFKFSLTICTTLCTLRLRNTFCAPSLLRNEFGKPGQSRQDQTGISSGMLACRLVIDFP